MLELQSLQSQLAVLKVTFDEAIMKGQSFQEVKRIYIQIKALEKAIAERQLHLLTDREQK